MTTGVFRTGQLLAYWRWAPSLKLRVKTQRRGVVEQIDENSVHPWFAEGSPYRAAPGDYVIRFLNDDGTPGETYLRLAGWAELPPGWRAAE